MHGPGARAVDPRAATEAVQAEVFPLQRNWFRSGEGLQASLRRLDALWLMLHSAAPPPRALARRTREAAAMLATARWMYRSALARTETRGMHRRVDHAALDPRQQYHLISGGLDEVWVDTQAAAHPLDLRQAFANGTRDVREIEAAAA
jgi:succinate dehydrogenase/fumarate reductase flavoprotein subunit